MVRDRRLGGQGFTLIELLVVIVILGIISGVVVFAVRGAGDKGKQAAVETDRRIIRTAMETFCARYGRYAEDMDELVHGPRDAAGGRLGKGFLSEASTYNHDIVFNQDGPNSCGGTTYQLVGEGPAKCFQSVDNEEQEVEVTAAMKQQGYWCLAATPIGDVQASIVRVNGMVQLRSGKVLAAMERVSDLDPSIVGGRPGSTAGIRMGLFDPADGPRGSWSDAAILRMPGESGGDGNMNDMLVLKSRDGHPEDCGSHCGKVLAHISASAGFGSGFGYWALYDETQGPSGEWRETEQPAKFPRLNGARAVQLLEEGCEPHCGKVLIVGDRPTIAELYNPKTNEFELSSDYSPPGEGRTHTGALHDYRYSTLTPLKDKTGQVLMVIQHITVPINDVRLFDPKSGSNGGFVVIPGPERKYEYEHRPQMLPDGGVLFLHKGTKGEIFRSTSARWEEVDSCTDDPEIFCDILASLPHRGVLVHRTDKSRNSYPGSTKPDSRRFTYSSGAASWTDTANLDNPKSAGPAVLLTGTPAMCGANCNKVLTANGKRSELYTPPL